jgi:trimeric autotransporter adhesin
VRRAGANWALSYDGQAVAQEANNQQIEPSPNSLLVGRPQDGRDFSVNGRIDDAAIWNGSLSDEQVTLLWNGGTGTPANAIG